MCIYIYIHTYTLAPNPTFDHKPQDLSPPKPNMMVAYSEAMEWSSMLRQWEMRQQT